MSGKSRTNRWRHSKRIESCQTREDYENEDEEYIVVEEYPVNEGVPNERAVGPINQVSEDRGEDADESTGPDEDAGSEEEIQTNNSPVGKMVSCYDDEGCTETEESGDLSGSSDDERENFDGSEDEREDSHPSEEDDDQQESQNTEEPQLSDDEPAAPPIYQNAPLTLYDSFIAVLAYALRHNLTGVALVDLLILISLHCAVPAAYKVTMYHFKKVLGTWESPVKYHYFCGTCYAELPTGKSLCPKTKQVKHPGKLLVSYLIVIPLLLQIQQFFARPNSYGLLAHRFTRKTNGNICDIYDGKIYKKYSRPGGFLANRKNISFMWYLDGVALFKSCKNSLWPVYLVVNELPPKERFKRENMFVVGLWFGGTKPNVYLRTLLPIFQALYDGFQVTPYGTAEKVTMRAMILCGTCDLPAKTCFLNMVGTNGSYGCPICKTKGESETTTRNVKIDGEMQEVRKGHVWTFPYKENHPLRSHEETVGFAKTLREMKMKKPTLVSYYGVKGPSVLTKIMPDVVFGIGIDVMHQIFEGINKKFVDLWFSAKYKDQPFSLYEKLEEVDDKLRKICPPWYIKRTTRSIADDIKYWKASEFKNFFLYYALPILSGIMEPIYLNHFGDLLYAIYTLSTESVSLEDIAKCQILLDNFVKDMETLYGKRHLTINTHLLQHLPLIVENLGPTWVYSCFRFEDFNGKMVQLFHGTRYADKQIANNVLLLRDLPIRIQSLTLPKLKDFAISCLQGSNRRLKATECITPGSYSVGIYTYLIYIPDLIRSALIAVDKDFYNTTCNVFTRLKKGSKLYGSESYERSKKAYHVTYQFEGILQYGLIKNFLRLSTCNCKSKACRCPGAQFLAIIEKLLTYRLSQSQNVVHIQRFEKTQEYIAVPIEDLQEVLINVENYLCEPVNSIEVE